MDRTEQIRKLVKDFVERRRHVLVYSLAQALESKVSDESDTAPWIEISSLSQLRSIVGGRFKNLKDKWLESGFPLKEHRGDQKLVSEVHFEAWLRMLSWINKQGYDARLCEDRDEVFFELRERGPRLKK